MPRVCSNVCTARLAWWFKACCQHVFRQHLIKIIMILITITHTSHCHYSACLVTSWPTRLQTKNIPCNSSPNTANIYCTNGENMDWFYSISFSFPNSKTSYVSAFCFKATTINRKDQGFIKVTRKERICGVSLMVTNYIKLTAIIC